MFSITDPSALLRPWRNLQQFTEELYAMLKSGGQAEDSVAPQKKTTDKATEPKRARVPDQPDVADANAIRKSRLETARTRVVLPEPEKVGSHEVRPRTPTATDEGAHREPQAPVESQPIPGTGPPPTPRQKEPRTEAVFETRTVATSDDHSSSRRVPVVADYSPTAPVLGAGAERSAKRDRQPTVAQPVLADEPDHASTRRSSRHSDENHPPLPELASQPPKPRKKYDAPPSPLREISIIGPEHTRLKHESRPSEPAKSPKPKRHREPRTPNAFTNFPFQALDIGDFANQVGGGGSSSIFIGQVQSDSTGGSAGVLLYPDGPHGIAGDMVEVEFPNVDHAEIIPAGMWIYSIFQFTDSNGLNDYFANPPTWVS